MSDAPVVEVREVSRHFPVRRGAIIRRRAGTVRAVDGVSLSLEQGRTLGIVGESGCGKTTLARLILGLDTPTAGTVIIDGQDTADLGEDQWKQLRRRVQAVFQDPYSSLNPRLTVRQVIEEPLIIHGIGDHAARGARVRELLELVGMDPDRGGWYPHQFSGGQRQRIGIARALALDPQVIVCDEPVSALDVSVQAQVINLLRRLQRELSLSLIFISHDLSVVRHVSDRIAVMYLGRVVEEAPVAQLFADPQHPYTQALLSAVPVPRTTQSTGGPARRIILHGDPPSPLDPPSGCHFRTRCWKATAECAAERPSLVPFAADGEVACLHPGPAPVPGEGLTAVR